MVRSTRGRNIHLSLLSFEKFGVYLYHSPPEYDTNNRVVDARTLNLPGDNLFQNKKRKTPQVVRSNTSPTPINVHQVWCKAACDTSIARATGGGLMMDSWYFVQLWGHIEATCQKYQYYDVFSYDYEASCAFRCNFFVVFRVLVDQSRLASTSQRSKGNSCATSAGNVDDMGNMALPNRRVLDLIGWR